MERITFTSHVLRSAEVDVGARGESPGDEYLFEERLSDEHGAVIGSDSVRCTRIVASTRCDGTFVFRGRGSVEVSQSFVAADARRLAVVGGTGDFRGVRGEAHLVEGGAEGTGFEFDLLR